MYRQHFFHAKPIEQIFKNLKNIIFYPLRLQWNKCCQFEPMIQISVQ